MLKNFFGALILILLVISCAKEEQKEVTPIIQVNAKFEADRSIILQNDAVQFKDLSTGNPISWKWEFIPDFGNGIRTSEEQNPKITFQNPGNYSVKLAASNGNSESSTRLPDVVKVVDSKTPPFGGGTNFINPDLFDENDPTSFVSIEDGGQEMRTMYDRRVEAWTEVNALIFVATYDDGQKIDVQVNPEFNINQAREYANFYANAVGQIPRFLIKDVKTISIQGGDQLFGGGSNDILVHVVQGEKYIHDGYLEETIIHEAGHVALQHLHSDNSYLTALQKDPTFISTYAQQNPNREDVPESLLTYLALKFKSDRLSEENKFLISNLNANRIIFFDSQNYDFYPLEK